MSRSARSAKSDNDGKGVDTVDSAVLQVLVELGLSGLGEGHIVVFVEILDAAVNVEEGDHLVLLFGDEGVHITCRLVHVRSRTGGPGMLEITPRPLQHPALDRKWMTMPADD